MAESGVFRDGNKVTVKLALCRRLLQHAGILFAGDEATLILTNLDTIEDNNATDLRIQKYNVNFNRQSAGTASVSFKAGRRACSGVIVALCHALHLKCVYA